MLPLRREKFSATGGCTIPKRRYGRNSFAGFLRATATDRESETPSQHSPLAYGCCEGVSLSLREREPHMPFIREVPAGHECDLPDPSKYGLRSIFKCDVCEIEWEMKNGLSIGSDPRWVIEHSEWYQ